MSLCRILNSDGRPEYALYNQGQVCPLHALMDSPPVGPQLFDTDLSKLPKNENVPVNLWQAAPDTLLPPVPMPEKLFCIGLNYRDHALETGAEIPSEPVVFSKFNTAIVGHGDAIELPSISSRVDYEAELVVVI